MSSTDAKQIDALFAEARLLSPGERAAFLDAQGAHSSPVRAEVERLLRALDDAGDFLEALDFDQAAALIGSGTDAAPLEREIGPYRIVRELGHGGMGAVYLAERADGQFEQQVALKLIRRGMDSDAILRRFLNERQILAGLQHASIARLLDGGISEGGQPYFAMEYVDGTPLTAYCDRHRLDIEARLRLFVQVCHAVQYAHAKLVVHRDLKPANMLVTQAGELKLLDFGIAKLLDEEGDAGVETLACEGLRALTPEYAAPEQVRGEAVTTATDVYALSVVLYELLTGQLPYRFEQRSLDAMARVISETDPAPPSTVVTRATHASRRDGTTRSVTPETVSRERHTDPERLKRRLRGDLDVIVLKAMRKEAQRRYTSVEAFAEDVRRHLAGRPVTARRDTLAYRSRKFVRRHWAGTLAASLVAASLVVGLSVALWQADAARREARKAEAVKDFMLTLFELSDPDAVKGDTITARELLDSGAVRVDTELPEQADLRADLMAVVGEGYRKLGLYQSAQPLLQEALALRRTVLGDDHEDIAASLHGLAIVHKNLGDYAAAEPLLREALAMQRRLFGPNHPAVAATLNTLAELAFDQGDYDGSEQLFREALAMRRALLGDSPEVATSLNDLAVVLHKRGADAAAEPLFREALAMQTKLFGRQHTDVTQTLNNLGLVLQARGDYEAAEPLFREALETKRELLGREHPSVALTLNNLGVLLRRKGDYAAAEPLYREALAIRRKALGEEHPFVAISISNLAVLLRLQGDYAAAETLLREALDMKRRLLGEEHPSVAVSLASLGSVAHERGDYEAAESLHGQALAMRRKLLGPSHPRVATSLKGLASAVLAQGRPAQAEQLLREALTILEAALPAGDWRQAEIRNLLGASVSEQGRYGEAEPLLLESYAALQASLGEADETLQARDLVEAHYARQGRDEEAARYRVR